MNNITLPYIRKGRRKLSRPFHVKVLRYANSGNHLHILAKAQSRKGFQRFLKTIAGVIPRIITRAKKGKAVGKFWDNLAYSKMVSWGQQFKNTSNYILKNTLEAFGIIPPRTSVRGHVKIDFEELAQEIFDG